MVTARSLQSLGSDEAAWRHCLQICVSNSGLCLCDGDMKGPLVLDSGSVYSKICSQSSGGNVASVTKVKLKIKN